MTFIQRRLKVDATSQHCIDVEATLYKRHVPTGVYLSLELTSKRLAFGNKEHPIG